MLGGGLVCDRDNPSDRIRQANGAASLFAEAFMRHGATCDALVHARQRLGDLGRNAFLRQCSRAQCSDGTWIGAAGLPRTTANDRVTSAALKSTGLASSTVRSPLLTEQDRSQLTDIDCAGRGDGLGGFKEGWQTIAAAAYLVARSIA